jgi:hypothetical protein
MGYLGYKPADKPLTAADITDSIITSAKIVDGTIANADINSSAAISLSKLSTTGTADATTFLRGDGAYTAVSSDYVLLATTDASSSASVSFDGYFSSTYKNYQIIISNIIPSTSNVFLECRFRRSNADITASSYTHTTAGGTKRSDATETFAGGTWNGSFGRISAYEYISTSASDGGMNGNINIFNPLNTSAYKHITTQVGYWNPSRVSFNVSHSSISLIDSTSALSGISFYMTSGNIASGNFKLYGIK